MKERQSVAQILTQAFAAYDAGRSDSARQLTRALENYRPEPPGLAYLLGLLALDAGQGRKAAQHLSRALSQSPDAVPPRLAMARAQVNQGRYAEALAQYRLLATSAPDLAAAWQEYASLLLAGGDYMATRTPLHYAVRLNPSAAPPRNNLGIALRALDDFSGAIHCFRQAIALDPFGAKPYANLAGLRRHHGHSADSLAARAVRIDPRDGPARVEYAQSLPDAEAIGQLDAAITLLPNQPEPVWLRAEALRRLNREEEAVAAYRDVLALDPEDRFGANLALAALGQGEAPERASAAHIRTLYDQYAESFERNLRNDLHYRGPEIIGEALAKAGIGGPADILDIGCGTGLAAPILKPLARSLDGIDLSEKMASQARARKLYDWVETGDFLEILAARPGRYDLICAADVLIYLGDLTQVCRAAALALKSPGHFAVTVEHAEPGPWRLQPTGRFAHSRDHLRQAAAGAGLEILLLEPVSTRKDQGAAVPGLLCLARKP